MRLITWLISICLMVPDTKYSNSTPLILGTYVLDQLLEECIEMYMANNSYRKLVYLRHGTFVFDLNCKKKESNKEYTNKPVIIRSALQETLIIAS